MKPMTSLTLFLGAALMIAFIFAMRAVLTRKTVQKDAHDDYAYKKSRGMIDSKLSEEGYKRAYMRFYSPRKFIFMAIAFACVAVLTIPMMGLIRAAMIAIWENSGRPDDIQPGFLVSNLLIMLGLLVFWALIFFICARFYYRNAPVSLRDEMIKEMD